MLDAVMLVLREVLEAALIISLLLALSKQLQLRFQWSLIALSTGTFGSFLLAHYAYQIAEAMEGTGQELLNAALYLLVVVSVIFLVILILLSFYKPAPVIAYKPDYHRLIPVLFIVIVSFSLVREGSEIVIYLSSFTQEENNFASAFIGAAIGAGIGTSLGAITYYTFSFMPKKIFIPSFLILISLLAGGLSMQIAKQLMQIGMLDSGMPLWDSSFLINEHSWLGELLYALLGYDSRPVPVQGIFYVLTLMPILITCTWHLYRYKRHE